MESERRRSLDGELPEEGLSCYSALVRREDIAAFARRDWTAIAESKRRRWAAQKAAMTAGDALDVGDDLRNYVMSLNDHWPSEEDRRNDLVSCQV
jgi:hypothetical protein